MANIPMWTHLSNHIFPSQFSCGNADPGIVKRKVEILNHRIAGINEGFTFFNVINFSNIKWKKVFDYLIRGEK